MEAKGSLRPRLRGISGGRSPQSLLFLRITLGHKDRSIRMDTFHAASSLHPQYFILGGCMYHSAHVWMSEDSLHLVERQALLFAAVDTRLAGLHASMDTWPLS